MPYSNQDGKEDLRDFLAEIPNVSRIVDIGPGAGSYFDLLHYNFPNIEWVAVEAWAPYVLTFELAKRYDNIIISDVRWVNWDKVNNSDIVIMGDILEHMDINEARSVLNEAAMRSRYVVVSVPIIRYEQGAVGGNPFEEHVIHYDEKSAVFTLLNGYDIVYLSTHDVIGIYVVKGELV